jgi:hypothetical protein
MSKKFHNWWLEIKKNKRKIIISLFFLIVAVVLYSLSLDYLENHKGFAISPDLILDNFGPYNLSYIYIWLFIAIVVIFFIYPLIFKPGELNYAINMFSFFLIVRSGFVIFTHLQLPSDAIDVSFPGILRIFNSTNDLFFSGHAGLPFLGYLIFHDNKKMRYFMLISSIVLAITVLVMHVHYSIDVLSAFFITYGVYVLGNKFVRK